MGQALEAALGEVGHELGAVPMSTRPPIALSLPLSLSFSDSLSFIFKLSFHRFSPIALPHLMTEVKQRWARLVLGWETLSFIFKLSATLSLTPSFCRRLS